jgi:hypothetical protein
MREHLTRDELQVLEVAQIQQLEVEPLCTDLGELPDLVDQL